MFRGLYTCTYSSVSSVFSLTSCLRPVLSVRLRLLVVFVFPYAVFSLLILTHGHGFYYDLSCYSRRGHGTLAKAEK